MRRLGLLLISALIIVAIFGLAAVAGASTLKSHPSYADWTIPAGSESVTVKVHFASTPSPNTFYQVWDGDLGGAQGDYMGVQTDGTGCVAGQSQLIWSQFGTATAPHYLQRHGEYIESAVDSKGDGTFTSIRQCIAPVRSGETFTFTVHLAYPNGFELTINHRAYAMMVYPMAAAMSDHGGSWMEYWPNNYSATPVMPPPSSAIFTVTSAIHWYGDNGHAQDTPVLTTHTAALYQKETI